ncbi:MAG: hypothetical protein ACLTCI_03460 [[Clostridium] nexile]
MFPMDSILVFYRSWDGEKAFVTVIDVGQETVFCFGDRKTGLT